MRDFGSFAVYITLCLKNNFLGILLKLSNNFVYFYMTLRTKPFSVRQCPMSNHYFKLWYKFSH